MIKRSVTPSQLGIVVIVLVMLLSTLGTVFVFEASVAESLSTFGDRYYLFKQHLVGLLIGWIAFFVGLMIPAKIWIKISPIVMVTAIISLILVFIPGVGINLNGASRWLSIAGLTIQPVEIVKFALITYLAAWLPKQKDLWPFLIIVSIPTILLILQPDLGSLLVVFTIACSLYFVAGGNLKQLGIMTLITIPLLVVAIVTSPYRMQRVLTFFNPDSDPLGSSYHVRQIVLALGRGGLFGQGLGNSTQRFSYIPEASTDSIFAIVAEETGFVGSSIIICMFALLIFIIFKLVNQTQNSIEIKLLGNGLAIWITAQTLLNLSAVVALVPLTGVPLPFFSYGRTALIMILFATGVLLNTGKKS
jgi:cell division protein FtsW